MPDAKAPYTWSEEALEQIDPPPFSFEGRSYTAYEATQQQRKIERAIRQTKRELMGWGGALKDCPKEAKQVTQEQFDALSVKLKRQRELYARFSKAAGLKEQNERTQEYGFSRSYAAKAASAARAAERRKIR